MDTNLDVLGIIKRAKQALNLKRDSELAEYLGVSESHSHQLGRTKQHRFPLVARQIGDKVDYNWLLLGKGNPKHQPRHCGKRTGAGRSRDYTQSENTRTNRRP